MEIEFKIASYNVLFFIRKIELEQNSLRVWYMQYIDTNFPQQNKIKTSRLFGNSQITINRVISFQFTHELLLVWELFTRKMLTLYSN